MIAGSSLAAHWLLCTSKTLKLLHSQVGFSFSDLIRSNSPRLFLGSSLVTDLIKDTPTLSPPRCLADQVLPDEPSETTVREHKLETEKDSFICTTSDPTASEDL